MVHNRMKGVIGTAVVAVLLALLIVSAWLPGAPSPAYAAEDISFTVTPGIYDYDTGVFSPIMTDLIQSEEQVFFELRLDGSVTSVASIQFKYYTNTQREAAQGILIDSFEWIESDSLNPGSGMPQTADGGYIWAYPKNEENTYIVFMAQMTVLNASGGTEVITYKSTDVRQLIISMPVSQGDIEIVRFKTEYARDLTKSSWETYYPVEGEGERTSMWVSTAIRFTLTSRNMEENRDIPEKFFYSFDQVNWTPAQSIIIFENKNLNGPIYFKITDRMGKNESYCLSNIKNQDNPSDTPIFIQMDTVSPEFTVSAVTTQRQEDGSSQQISYNTSGGQWSANNITYRLHPVKTGESVVKYQYRAGANGIWIDMTSTTEGDQTYYWATFSSTTRDIEFQAFNAAGLTYKTQGTYDALIDTVQPIVSVTARDNPKYTDLYTPARILSFGDTSTPAEAFRVGYARDSVTFTVYNRTAGGSNIINSSALVAEYCVLQSYDSEGNPVFSAYKPLTENIDGSSLRYYTIQDNTAGRNKIYKFRLTSQSGMTNEKQFNLSIISSDFAITVDPITRVENAAGWAKDRIAVYVNVPIADKYTFVYRISGTDYANFIHQVVWAADGSGAGENEVQNVTEQFSNLHETHPQYVNAATHMKFRIYLSTSVERRYFVISVKNAADVESNGVQTPELKLDMVPPQVLVTATVQNSDIILIQYKSGDYPSLTEMQKQASWANGNITLVLDSRALGLGEISLSGIKCELMNDENVPQYDLMPETDAAGLSTGRFSYTVEYPVNATGSYQRTILFRLTSGSGLQNYVRYDAKIDKRNMTLEYVNYANPSTNTVSEILRAGSDSPFIATIEDISQNITFNFNANQTGHYSIYYKLVGVDSDYTLASGTALTIPIENNKKGLLQLEFYLESYAQNKDGLRSFSAPYTIYIPYDTVSLVFSASILNTVPELPYITDSSGWRNGPLNFQVQIDGGNEGNYTYGMLLIGNLTPAEYLAQLGLSGGREKAEIFKYVYMIPSIYEGVFSFYGANENGEPIFSMYEAENANQCFYNGSILLYAFNSAKYASDVVPFNDRNIIKLDNSTPDSLKILAPINGEIYENTIYNNQAIVLRDPDFSDRSTITYFYKMVVPADPKPDLPTKLALNGWSRLNSGEEISISSADAYYVFYALNDLNKGSVLSKEYLEVYGFRVDTLLTPSLTLNYPQGQGGDGEVEVNGEVLKVFAYRWAKTAEVGLGSNSNTPIRYYYTTDFGATWIECFDTPQNAGLVRFEFKDNINATVMFKMVNLAGTEVRGILPAIVRIDTKRPEFLLSAEFGGQAYNGGNAGSINTDTGEITGINFAAGTTWASGAVTIVITIEEGKENTSKVRYSYKVKTATNETNFAEIPTKSIINRRITFTTDRLDNFGENNDAVIIILAECDANGYKYAQAIRVRVDKVVPEFALKGEVYASNDSNRTITITSGTWTNQEEVRISLAMAEYAKNVSPVSIYYSYSNSSSRFEWPAGMLTVTAAELNGRTEVITVEATSAAGKRYTQIFEVNIDTVPPVIISGTITPSETGVPNTYYIDQPITYREANVKYAQYITRKGADAQGGLVGFPLSQGHIIATNSVDNSEESKGYVKIIIEDLAGNKAELEFYMVPFGLDINNLNLSQEHMDTLDKYEEDLANAKGIDDSRRAYFENQIARLRDRETTLRQEIAGFQSYLSGLAQKTSYELKSDYAEMFSYIETYNNYEYYGQQWIQEEIKKGIYAAYFEKLLTEFRLLQKEMDKVTLVENNAKKLPAINVVKVNDYNSVLQVHDAYSDLTPDQKACFAPTLYNKIIALKKSCENMLLQDTESGVYVEGNLAPGAKIDVTSYSNTVELFNNTQATILDTIDADAPRTVVSIHKVSLKGAASQTSTGKIMVSLPIPEEYQNYVRWTVYRLSVDGTVTEVRGVNIEGDGKSVTFSAEGLDTYVLAARANIAVRETNDDVYGTVAGIEVDPRMLAYMATAVVGVFGILIVVVIITSVRRKRFLNRYNRMHRRSIYRKGVMQIPKGNTVPRENPFNPGERVKTPSKPYQ